MTVKYNYKCPLCLHTYMEMRAAEEPQFFTKCNSCGDSDYTEESVEVISETVERLETPELIIEEIVEEI
jgi:hypothetical protein